MAKFFSRLALVILALFLGFTIAVVQFRLSETAKEIEIEVVGTIGAPVTLAASPEGELRPEEISTQGEGRKIESGSQVLVRQTDFYFQDGVGRQVGSKFLVGSASAETLGELHDLVIGKREGSRVVTVTPDSSTSGTVVVVDVLYTLLPHTHSIAPDGGLPGVESDAAGLPVLTAAGPAPNFHSSVLVKGNGEAVAPGDRVIVNYMIVDSFGGLKENSWLQGEPVVFDVADAFEGLQAGLLDVRAGSRVLLSIPAAQAQGQEDLAVVMDLLAVIKPTS